MGIVISHEDDLRVVGVNGHDAPPSNQPPADHPPLGHYGAATAKDPRIYKEIQHAWTDAYSLGPGAVFSRLATGFRASLAPGHGCSDYFERGGAPWAGRASDRRPGLGGYTFLDRKTRAFRPKACVALRASMNDERFISISPSRQAPVAARNRRCSAGNMHTGRPSVFKKDEQRPMAEHVNRRDP